MTTTLRKTSFGVAIAAALAAPLAFATPSQAQATCLNGLGTAALTALGSTGCVIGDKIYSDFSFTNFAPSSTFAFTNAPTDQHTFSASGLQMMPGTAYSYSYKVSIVAGSGTTFSAYRTGSSTSDVVTPLVGTKTLDANPAGSPNPITSVNGGFSALGSYSPTIPGPITFSGSISVTSGRLDVFTDSVLQQEASATPGPLPILGAAAAFGSVRKLRKFSSALKQA
jgi:hypothetical protein